jgi:hypothetical protein
MGPLIGNSQFQLLWSLGYHSVLSFTVANEGDHILGTFDKHPHLGGQSPPLEDLKLWRGPAPHICGC